MKGARPGRISKVRAEMLVVRARTPFEKSEASM